MLKTLGLPENTDEFKKIFHDYLLDFSPSKKEVREYYLTSLEIALADFSKEVFKTIASIKKGFNDSEFSHANALYNLDRTLTTFSPNKSKVIGFSDVDFWIFVRNYIRKIIFNTKNLDRHYLANIRAFFELNTKNIEHSASLIRSILHFLRNPELQKAAIDNIEKPILLRKIYHLARNHESFHDSDWQNNTNGVEVYAHDTFSNFCHRYRSCFFYGRIISFISRYVGIRLFYLFNCEIIADHIASDFLDITLFVKEFYEETSSIEHTKSTKIIQLINNYLNLI